MRTQRHKKRAGVAAVKPKRKQFGDWVPAQVNPSNITCVCANYGETLCRELPNRRKLRWTRVEGRVWRESEAEKGHMTLSKLKPMYR